jgi:hypothetical protein
MQAILGSWLMVFIAVIALGSLAVGVPIAIMRMLGCAEALAAWVFEQMHREARPVTQGQLSRTAVKGESRKTTSSGLPTSST